MGLEYNLGYLSDSKECTEPLAIDGQERPWLKEALRSMLQIRLVEEKIGEMVKAGRVVCPCHLAIGQEAVAVGVTHHLRATDRAFGTHRSHSHYLAAGGSVEELLAEVLGKVTGCSRGMGGSMHLFAEDKGFKGSVPIVAGTVSLATGAALAAKLDGAASMDVGVAYFGDGAIEEGGVHESMNFASVFKLPMLFVCENNLFSSHLHINLRQPSERVARFAEAHRMAVEVVDGNDVVAVAGATERLLRLARSGEGPGFLEAVTYRHRGHVGPSEDIDVGLKREEDLVQWKKRDPIQRLKEAMKIKGWLTDAEVDQMIDQLQGEVESAWDAAVKAPYPSHEALLDLVYAPPSKGAK